MNLKVGDYVRINKTERNICVGIGRITQITNNTVYVNMKRIPLTLAFEKKDIANSSSNIMNLLEEWDLIETDHNGIVEIYRSKYYNNALCYDLPEHCPPEIVLIEDDIVSVVTKEQFENMKYNLNN